jgi:hypothetical protein
MKLLQCIIFTRLKDLMLFVILSTACALNSGCSSLSFFAQEPFEITYSSPDRISFQGKGAGAGIALMSTMGPVGIALGVAIDEGIAKDIRNTAKAGSVDFKSLFSEAVSNIDVLKDADRIDVKKYGFVIKDGSKDYVAAEVRIVMHNGDVSEELVLSSWKKQKMLDAWVTLEDIKKNPESIEKLFSYALINHK